MKSVEQQIYEHHNGGLYFYTSKWLVRGMHVTVGDKRYKVDRCLDFSNYEKPLYEVLVVEL